jgi:hypothetical protein
MECHRIANSLIRPGEELPEDYDQNILDLDEEERGEECGEEAGPCREEIKEDGGS